MLHACPNHGSKSVHQFAADGEMVWCYDHDFLIPQKLQSSDILTHLNILDILVIYVLHTSFVSPLIIMIPHMSYDLILGS